MLEGKKIKNKCIPVLIRAMAGEEKGDSKGFQWWFKLSDKYQAGNVAPLSDEMAQKLFNQPVPTSSIAAFPLICLILHQTGK